MSKKPLPKVTSTPPPYPTDLRDPAPPPRIVQLGSGGMHDLALLDDGRVGIIRLDTHHVPPELRFTEVTIIGLERKDAPHA